MNIKLLEDTLADIKANGVSRPLVETLENTIGEKFISSVFNINGLTTERSSIGLGVVSEQLHTFIKESKEQEAPTRTLPEIVRLQGRLIDFLKSIKYVVESIDSIYNSRLKSILELHTFSYSWDGTNRPCNIFMNNSPLATFFNYKKDAPWYDLEVFKKWYDEFEGRKVFTILTLFVWKDNSLYEYIVNGKPIANYDITCGDLFTSLEDTHMIIESLEETIKSISAKQKSLIEDGYISAPNDLIYDIWEGLLSTHVLSYRSIDGIYKTLKEASEIDENENVR